MLRARFCVCSFVFRRFERTRPLFQSLDDTLDTPRAHVSVMGGVIFAQVWVSQVGVVTLRQWAPFAPQCAGTPYVAAVKCARARFGQSSF